MKSPLAKIGAFALLCTGFAAAQTTSSACNGISVGVNGSLNGFVPSATDAWHQDISNAPVDANSATILLSNANDLMGSSLHPDFGSTFGIPYNVVDSGKTAAVPVGITMYAADSDITVAPIPSDAAIEDSPASCPTDGNDRHMIVLDRNKCVAYEYWQAGQCNGSFSAANTALWDMLQVEKRPYALTSADAAGLSVFEGLIRYDEVLAGSINHAIRFTASHTKNNPNGGYFAAPATHAAGNNWHTDNIIGMRLRLKPNFDISGFSATNQIILRAMQKYGMILADNGSSLYFQGTADSRWNDNDLNALKGIPASAFDVVDAGTSNIVPAGATAGSDSTPDTMFASSNIYDTVTAPTGAAPVINSFSASAITVAPGTPVTLTANVSGDSYDYVDNAGFLRNGTVTLTPAATTTYTLSSRNAFGTSTATVTVTVAAPAPAPAPTAPTSTSGATSTGGTLGSSSTPTSSGGTSSGTGTSGTSSSTTAAAVGSTTTSLSMQFFRLSSTQYQVVITTNSLAPVALSLVQGAAVLNGTVLTVSSPGMVSVLAMQNAATGFTSGSTRSSIDVEY